MLGIIRFAVIDGARSRVAGLRPGSRAPVGRALGRRLGPPGNSRMATPREAVPFKTGHPRSRKVKPVRRFAGLLAGVPEAFPPARVSVVPAEIGRHRRQCYRAVSL